MNQTPPTRGHILRRQALHLVVAAGLLVAATACEDLGPTGGEEQQPAGQETPATPQTPAPDEDEGEGEGGGTAPAAPSRPPDGVIASKEVGDAGTTFRVDITDLVRNGEIILLVWNITNVGDESVNVGSRYGSFGVNMGSDDTVDGTTLVDPVNGQRYLVARAGGEDGPCVCSRDIAQHFNPGDSAEYNATFRAPPPEVTEVNVDIQDLGVFSNVPIY